MWRNEREPFYAPPTWIADGGAGRHACGDVERRGAWFEELKRLVSTNREGASRAVEPVGPCEGGEVNHPSATGG